MDPEPFNALAYGPVVGEYGRSQMVGPLDNALGPEDIAISPNRLEEFPLGSQVNATDADGNLLGTYNVADTSWYHPGKPTKNTVEFRDRDISNQKVFLSPATPSLAEAMSVPLNSSPLAAAAINTLPTTPPIMSGPLQHAQFLTDESGAETGSDVDLLTQPDDTGEDTATSSAIRDSSDTPATPSDEVLAPKYHQGLRVVDQAPDGSWTKWSNGMVVNKLDRSITYMSPDGTKWLQRDGEKPIKLTPPPKDRVSFQTLTGPDGLPYSAEVNLDKHTVTPIGDPTTRAITQAQNLKLRIINSAKQQPGLQAYINVKNNYDSLRQNAAIPEKDRTPIDDAMAMQAAGAIEHPGTGITDADKKQMAGLVPFWTRVRMMYNNVRQNKSRTLTSQTVQEMAAAAKRTLDGRANTYQEQITPIKKQAIAAGLDPDEVVGSLFENATPLNQNTPNPQTGTIPVPPNIKVGAEVKGSADGSGPSRYYTGANPLDKTDPANWSTTPPSP